LKALWIFGGNDDYFDKELRGFWCDGIISQYNDEQFKQVIKDNGFIELSMYFGRDGQDRYKLILHLGEKARHSNMEKQDLLECVPDFSKEPDSILIDEDNRIVKVFLK